MMYLWRNSRCRYVLHTLIHDPKPITTDPMTMNLRWRRSWYDLGCSRYSHADQLTFWVRSNRRYLSRPYRYMHRPLPISSSCPSVPWIQYTSPAFGSNAETACHFWATDCPGTIIPMEGVISLTDRTANERDQTDHHQNRQKRSHCQQNSLEHPQ